MSPDSNTPPASASDPAPLAAPAFKLHSGTSVILATFLGSPIGGCIVLALNYFRVGMRRQAWFSILGGVLGTGLLVWLAGIIPDSVRFANLPFLVAQMGIMAWLAQRLQGQMFKKHIEAGGRAKTKWAAAGIGVASLLVLCGVIIGVLVLTTGPSGTRFPIGASEVFCAGAATESDAHTLDEALKKSGIDLNDHPMTVQLSKDATGFTLCFVVKSTNRENPETIEGFRSIGHNLIKAAPLSPLTIWLCDDDMTRQKKIVIE